METAPRRKTTALDLDLTQNGSQFTFIQALRMLRLKALRLGKTLFDSVRVRSDLSFSFPHGEVAAIEKTADDPERFTITATFLGLYGTGSPLPMFYTQELFTEQRDGRSVKRDFYDIFNGVLYEAYFYAWKKNQFLHSLFEDFDAALVDRLLCLAGINNTGVKKEFSEPLRQVRYAGLSSRPAKSAEGLRTILADTLNGPTIAVEQCVPRMAPIPPDQQIRLGKKNNILGVSTVIGKKMLDRMGSFRVHLGPVHTPVFNSYLPDRAAFSAIAEQIRFYEDQLLAWDVEVYCKTRGMASVLLGNTANALLGWNTWVFTGNLAPDHVSARFKPRVAA